jgi:hypothetical protein
MKAIDPKELGATPVRAPHCEGLCCRDPGGEVLVYPLLFAAHLILCRHCWDQENRYRHEHGSLSRALAAA